jgi:hypothetical protein
MNPTLHDPCEPDVGAMPLLMAADLQDHLMVASNDLDRLQRLLSDTCDTLLASFHGAIQQIGTLVDPASATERQDMALYSLQEQLGAAVTALQFQDLASQLIAHTHQRLRNCADQLARDAFGADADGEAVVASAPLRPNPVTQDEMDAGSITLF